MTYQPHLILLTTRSFFTDCKRCTVNGTVLEWLKSYLHHRQHKVSINDNLSTARTLRCGVPQGSVLGARMYSMYVKPLSDIMNRHNVMYHTYADDIQL